MKEIEVVSEGGKYFLLIDGTKHPLDKEKAKELISKLQSYIYLS